MGTKESAIKQFGKQAEAYSKGSIFPDRDHLSKIVKKSGVARHQRVLDIATGTGFLALEFAKTAGAVIGSDLTRNMLAYAIEKQKSSGLSNIGFLLSDVESLPFPDNSFDVVSCRFAFHHFPDPIRALLEIKRVCRDSFVLIDGVSSEDLEKSQLHNRIEKLRDPSHVRIYTLSEINKMFHDLDFIIEEIEHWDIRQEFDDWIKRAGTDENVKKVIRNLLIKSMKDDGTGLRVNLINGEPGFIYDTIILKARVKGI